MTAPLGACAARDPFVTSANAIAAGNWKIEQQPDRITGAPVGSAQLATEVSSNSADTKVRPAMLQLTCFDKTPIVRISFAFKVGTDRNTIVGYRFDDKPGRDNIESRILSDHTIVVIEDGAEVKRFLADMADASKLVIRLRSLNAGRTTAEFKLDGAPAAIEAAYKDCPLAGPPKGRANS
ncbi:MAG: hypothetical protein EKK40_16185 [Bradyrhizobiaceae bacterium]|nr:MAG: hypothetical protein EKK40_16185 [Bradyrhizobiaceae bacterium]